MLSSVFKWTQLAKGRTMIEAEVFPRIKSLFLCYSILLPTVLNAYTNISAKAASTDSVIWSLS